MSSVTITVLVTSVPMYQLLLASTYADLPIPNNYSKLHPDFTHSHTNVFSKKYTINGEIYKQIKYPNDYY